MQEYQTSDYCFHHGLPVVPSPTLKQLTVLWSWPLCLYYIVKHSVSFMGNNKLGSSSGFWWFRLASLFWVKELIGVNLFNLLQKPKLLTLSSYLFTPFHPPFRSPLALQLTCQSSLFSWQSCWNRARTIYWGKLEFFEKFFTVSLNLLGPSYLLPFLSQHFVQSRELMAIKSVCQNSNVGLTTYAHWY